MLAADSESGVFRMSAACSHGALAGNRFRVIVCTDIGGSDPDDFQSMVHYLLYADLFDTEALISSPWGEGSIQDLYRVMDAYAEDYPCLHTWSASYPAPDALRAVTFQGARDIAPYKGWSEPTAASERIIACARQPDPRPLYLLMWGLLEDLAQALHDAPDILPRLRVYAIGGPNKKWGQNAYAYIREQFPDLWMIENNSTYRGWFNGGDMTDPWGNRSFVTTFVSGHGALGSFYAGLRDGEIKMGDTPSVAWLLSGDPEHPEQESWGGSFERVYTMPAQTLSHPVTETTEIEVFSVAEICFSGPVCAASDMPVFFVEIQGQTFSGYAVGDTRYRFRFVPKRPGDFTYRTHSRIPELDGLSGLFHVVPECAQTRRFGNLTHWWSDRLEPELQDGIICGARTINRWRKEYLRSFASRLERCCTVRPQADTDQA